MSERILISVDQGVADVRFNRPEKINALDRAQFEAIDAALMHLEKLKGLRVVVLSGEGRGFCVGIDLEDLQKNPPTEMLKRTHGIGNIFQRVAWGWRALPVPVISAVHGFALGGGFQIMLGADMRLATADVQMSVMEVRWGLVPDMGGTALLQGLVRDDVARELTYTARKFSGIEAANLGLVTRVCDDPHAEALVLARQIASNSPQAVQAAKRLFNQTYFGTAAEMLCAESEEAVKLLASAGHRETLKAAQEKRPPAFVD